MLWIACGGEWIKEREIERMGLQMEGGDVICNKRCLNETIYVIQTNKKGVIDPQVSGGKSTELLNGPGDTYEDNVS